MSVSILMVRVLISAVEHAGGQREQLLAAARLEPARLDDRNDRLSFAEYERVQHAALAVSGDEALGLHMGEQLSAAAFDVLGHLTEHAASLRQSIEAIMRYSRVFSEAPSSALCEEGETASIRFNFRHGSAFSARLPAELAMSGLLRLLRLFAGPAANARRVCFEYEPPPHRDEYTRIFAGSECFGQSYTGIDFDRAWLERTQLYENPELYTALQTQAERALGRVQRELNLVDRVHEHLTSYEPAQMPAMDDVARHFDMSARSLRRRLSAEGASYKALLERALATIAKRLLENPRMSIQQTADAMGFATPASFHRAFKRWTGLTPKAYKASY
jgi:AraC-like DNA-binding protein